MLLAFSAVMLLATAIRLDFARGVYGQEFSLEFPGDYWEYLEAARHILVEDDPFKRGVFHIRPPVFPLVMAAAQLHRPTIILLNTLFALLQIPLAYALIRVLKIQARGGGVALLAALLIALDPTHIKFSGTLIAEPLHGLLFLLGILLTACVASSPRKIASASFGALAGVVLFLASLTRPSTYLLWIALSLWLLFRRRSGRFLTAGLFAVISLVATLAYSQHNLRVHSNPSFSALGTYNLLHYRAARYIDASQMRQLLEEQLGYTNDLSDERFLRRTRKPESDMESAMFAVAARVIRDNFSAYLREFERSFSQTLFEVWPPSPPGGQTFKTAVFVCALFGGCVLLYRRQARVALLLAIPVAYFTMGTVLVCLHCMDSRATVAVVPLIAIAAAIWLDAFGAWALGKMRRAATKKTKN